MLRTQAMGQRHASGFTLIEALIVTLLAALVGTLMIEALRISQGAYRKATTLEQNGRDIFIAQRALRRLIESSLAPPAVFVGSADHLELEAPSSAGEGDPSITRYALLLRRAGSAGTADLVVRWRTTDTDTTAGTEKEEVLLEGVAALRIAYLARQTTDTAPAWSDAWPQTQQPPALVRMEVQFSPKDGRQWPALLAAPRITHDPNCKFDMVAQDCRET